MRTKLIVMLTHHDKTVPNALEIFETAKDLEVECWGFKDVGIPKDQMTELLSALKKAGKQTFLEVVSYGERECMEGARLAVELGFDGLMGTLFYPEVWKYLKENQVNYYPFAGKVSGSPSVLEGGIDEIIQEGKEMEKQGVYGFDLLAYRYVKNPEELAERFLKEIQIPVVIAGSINSKERMEFVEAIGAWGYTMGSALFEKRFVPDGTFRQNLQAVIAAMNEIPDRRQDGFM